MMHGLLAGVPRRGLALLAILLAVLLAAPWLANDYLLTVLIIILYFAYTGQAWNVMTGFAGQLSLGHAIYVGLGGYVAGRWRGRIATVSAADELDCRDGMQGLLAWALAIVLGAVLAIAAASLAAPALPVVATVQSCPRRSRLSAIVCARFLSSSTINSLMMMAPPDGNASKHLRRIARFFSGPQSCRIIDRSATSDPLGRSSLKKSPACVFMRSDNPAWVIFSWAISKAGGMSKTTARRCG